MADRNRITTHASSEVKLQPSCARISFSVEEFSINSSAAALAALQKKRAVVRSLASPVAIIEQDQEATQPVYVYATGQPPRIARYRATASFTFLLNRLDAIQAFTEAVLRAGVTTIDQVAYDATEDEWLGARLVALERATKYAFMKAIAVAATVLQDTNIEVVSVDEYDGGHSHRSPIMRSYAFNETAAMAAPGGGASGAEVTPGLLSVEARLTMVTRVKAPATK
jgi:uncharacterized protein YggE